jgi:hypothetical protein
MRCRKLEQVVINAAVVFFEQRRDWRGSADGLPGLNIVGRLPRLLIYDQLFRSSAAYGLGE